MFDINNIINAAINAAVQQAIAPLMDQIHNLDAICQAQAERIEKLENNPAQGQDLTPTTGLTRAQVEDLIEAAIDEHCSGYDHDSYDEVVAEWGGESAEAYVKESEVEDTVRDVVGNLTFEVSVS